MDDHKSSSTETRANESPAIFQVPLLGALVTPIPSGALVDVIAQAVAGKQKFIIGNHNVRSLSLWSAKRFRRFFEIAKFSFIDGMPLIWMLKALGHPVQKEDRVTYVDLIYPLLEVANQKRWKVYHLGGAPEVTKKLKPFLAEKYPQIKFEARKGYFDHRHASAGSREELERIRNFSPDLLLVGLGMPLQELWISENFRLMNATVILTCGGMANYLVGNEKIAPRWMGRVGLEWFYRFIQDPARLFKRYFIEPWPVFFRFLSALWAHKTGKNV